MTLAWDPREVLDLHPELPGFHCAGTTLQGTRCRNNFFSRALLHEATFILDNLPHPSTFQRDPLPLFITLKQLARCTLCPRWHQGNKTRAGSQIVPVAQRWLAVLMGIASERNNQRPHGSPSHSSVSSPRIVTISDYTSSSASSSLSSRSWTNPAAAYPTPPSSRGTTPATSPAGSSSGSRNITRSQAPSPVPSHNTSSSNHPPSTPSSNSMSSSTRTNTFRTPNVQVTVNVNANPNIEVNIDPILQRRIVALDTPQSRSSAPSPPPSPPRSSNTSRSSSTSSSQARRTEIEALRQEVALLRAQLAERSSRASSRVSIAEPEAFYRSHAPSPSTNSGRSAARPRSAGEVPVQIPSPPVHAPRPVLLRQSIENIVRQVEAVPVVENGAGSSQEVANNPIVSQLLPLYLLSPPRQHNNVNANPTNNHVVAAAPVSSPFSAPVRRRPIQNGCYICREDIARPEDAEWCRSSCGQNFCLECFEEWQTTQVEMGRSGRTMECGHCRQPWRNS